MFGIQRTGSPSGLSTRLLYQQLEKVATMSEQHEDDDLPMFARGIAGPLGKLDIPAKTKIDEKTNELWLQLCAMQGVDTSSELRDFIYARVYGKTYRQMALEKATHDAKRTEALASFIGTFRGPESEGR